MSRRRSRLFAGLGLLAIVIAVVIYFWPSPPAQPWTRASAVQVGDSRAQLYAALGGPSGDYRRNRHAGVAWESHEQQIGAEMWMSDGGTLYIWFDGDDRVKRIHSEPSVAGPGWIQQIRSKLGL